MHDEVPSSGAPREPGQFLAIVGLGVFAAVFYGIVHDQITARICIEYFTIGHENLLGVDPHTASPTVQGLLWGVLATWWVGLILGVGSALSARLGRLPKRTARSLLRPVAVFLAANAALAMIGGLTGFGLASTGVIRLAPWLAAQIPADRHVAFLVDGWAHGASYLGGFGGGLLLWAWIVRKRRRQAAGTPASGTTR